MPRSRTRTSRTFIVILTFCLVVVAVVWIFKPRHTTPNPAQAADVATDNPTKPAGDQASVITRGEPTNPPPVITQTPFGSPANTSFGSAANAGNTAPAPAAQSQTAVTNSAQTPAAPTASGTVSFSNPTASPRIATNVTLSDHPLADAQAAMNQGNLLQARTILNAALLSGKLNQDEASQAKQLIGQANAALILSPTRDPNDPFVSTYRVASGDSLAKIASRYNVTWELLARMNGITNPRKLRAGQTIKVVQGPFSAVVNKQTFKIDLWLGKPEGQQSLYIMQFPVGLGQNDSTPDGSWIVRPGGKLKNPKFWGAGDLPPIEADDPKNPLGEYWIALDGTDGNAVGKQSYGIHGTIEPESIGHMASLGCIRMLNNDVELVYEMLADGKSPVIVRN